ncbi:MAG: hypothetical protein IJA10_10840 [Lachnospiraceae bacterium]|nr:hypothetical protein [Lachnospiraceae bacterium]
MYYMFSVSNLKHEVIQQILASGKAVGYSGMLLMSKETEFKFGNRTIKNDGNIDGWIYNLYRNKIVPLYDKVKIKSTEVADILVGELYQPCNNNKITYADKIYQSRKPKQEVIDLYNRFLLIAIDNRIMDCTDEIEKIRLEARLEQIKDDIHEGKCVWE